MIHSMMMADGNVLYFQSAGWWQLMAVCCVFSHSMWQQLDDDSWWQYVVFWVAAWWQQCIVFWVTACDSRWQCDVIWVTGWWQLMAVCCVLSPSIMIADGIVLCFQSQDGTATQRSACTPPTQAGWCGGRTSNEVLWPVKYAVVLIIFSPDTLRCMIARHSNTGKLVSVHSNGTVKHWQTGQYAQ